MIAVDLGMKPYGFTARFQALSCDWPDAGVQIAKVLFKSGKAIDSYIAALDGCTSFDDGNSRAQAFEWIDRATESQVDGLVAAYNRNRNLYCAYAFNGRSSRRIYGDGLVSYLHRWSSRRFQYSADYQTIELAGTVLKALVKADVVDDDVPF
jgi:hypothetical protein